MLWPPVYRPGTHTRPHTRGSADGRCHSRSGHWGLTEGEADGRMVRTSDMGTPASQQAAARSWQSCGLAMAPECSACRWPRSAPQPRGSGGPRPRHRTALEQLPGTAHGGDAALGCSSWGVMSRGGRYPAGLAGIARRTRVCAGREHRCPAE